MGSFTTTTIGSSAGAGLSVGLKAMGEVALLSTLYATALDIQAHASCASAGDPNVAMDGIQATPK